MFQFTINGVLLRFCCPSPRRVNGAPKNSGFSVLRALTGFKKVLGVILACFLRHWDGWNHLTGKESDGKEEIFERKRRTLGAPDTCPSS